MSEKTRKAISTRLTRLAEVNKPKRVAPKPKAEPKETGGTSGQS